MNAKSKSSVFDPVDKAAFRRFIETEPEGRYEFEGGRIVQQMTGAARTHYRLASRIKQLVEHDLDGTRHEVLLDLGVETAKTVRYADVVVAPVTDDGGEYWTTAPTLIVEVLSPSSIARDLDVKPAEYLALASLEAYVVASQSEQVCLARVRGTDRQFPSQPVQYGAGEIIAIDGLQLALAIDDIYRDVDLVPADQFPSS